ncbi:amidohydrolase family protein [Haliangium ochraceum]|uniref:Amidohydrolase n=1 Tax=Haliangium ochraceum (strain DSM 14365 / JCM 11303 / SMP-2) TaxID=502025 RepID=D0LK65_HALO1|nr:amidohydrolase family protein [Haliangium ochraceum]ACY13099.1 amidohydrolase [Haliangium ochraceum DSM 14365]
MLHRTRSLPLALTASLGLGLLGACAGANSTAPDSANATPQAHAQAAPLSFHPPAGAAAAPAKDGEKPKWNVEQPPGPTFEVSIDTDEGTWMSLDLSPDGKEIVFDMLGDLYTLPIAGGEAKPLTSGIAWDMQPRYSPDGRFIAFTSDRGGGDNLWIIDRQGENPRQVSSENFRLVNSPAWTPDGQFLVGRKHFTSRRSLGAGEMWLYHIAGGQGVQLTEKQNEQKDTGEPVFSPDGRYLYFSQDSTPGPVFEYNKDPHAGIYSIYRLDREEGHLETLISGPGGAVRPTPSPDGTRMAYVRRIGLDTALFVYDLASGEQRPVVVGLDRDMQETWAIHGVYPTMAWTPDNRSIVFWAGGKIQRVSIGAKAGEDRVSEIPFHVKDTRTVSKALRSPIEVAPERFHTRMLRSVQVAPDGSAAVYQALGHIYLVDLANGQPKGAPRRLTRDDDVFEFYPSFSRDGRSIVYVAWSDERLGSVRMIARRGGRSRTLTSQPGHYVEPVLSPDGKHLVYRKVGASSVRAQSYTHDTGLYALSLAGGEPERISRSGNSPHFGGDGKRVFFLDTEGGGSAQKFQLESVGIDGKDERVHLRSDAALEYAVSPDGRWVAFQEYAAAYVAPFPRTAKPIDISRESKAMPVTKVSADAGANLHWSGDSAHLFWSLGPELYTRALTEMFAFVDGAAAELPPLASQGVDLGFDVATAKPDSTIALVGGKAVTMNGDEVIDDAVIVIRGDRIAAVGPRASVTIPADARRIDVSGMSVIPGLIDVHAHGPQGGHGITPQRNWLHYATLAFGVTTVHDPSNDTGAIFAASELARAGMITAPRIFSTGTILYGANAPIKAVVDSFDDALANLRRMKAVGAFSVKSYNQPRREQRQQIIAAARELDMMVVPEGGSLFQHNMNMVVDGHTGIEHAVPLGRGYADMKQLWGATEVGYTPTLGVGYGGLWGENYWYAESDVFAHPRLTSFVPPFAHEARTRRRVLASEGDWNHIRIAALCKELLDAGVKIQLGAHGQREGLAAHWELWMLVQGGMSPHEALRAGTLHGAYYLGLDGDLGSIEAGKLADLAIVEGDVLSDIRRSENVRYTIAGGRVYDAATMDQIAPVSSKRAPFFWERDDGAAHVSRPADSEGHGLGCSCGAH